MPQLFNVLRCFECGTFQVQLVKTAITNIKWTCNMCGVKQSQKKVYRSGSGLECRKHVQKLNSMRGQFDCSERNEHMAAVDTAGCSRDDPMDSLDGCHGELYEDHDWEEFGRRVSNLVQDETPSGHSKTSFECRTDKVNDRLESYDSPVPAASKWSKYMHM